MLAVGAGGGCLDIFTLIYLSIYVSFCMYVSFHFGFVGGLVIACFIVRMR